MNPQETKLNTTEADSKPIAADGNEPAAHSHAGHDHAGHTHENHAPEMNEACKREVAIEIPTAAVAAKMEEVFKKYQKLANIPGFRKGKVPVSIIKKRFMEDIRAEVAESLIPEYFRAEVEKAKLMPVSQPRVLDLHFHDDEPIQFRAVFEVMPEFEVTGYKNLPVEKKDIRVTGDEVEEALKTLRERQASYDPLEDRALQDGDYALVSFHGTAKGAKAIAAKKAELEARNADSGPEVTESAAAAVQTAIEQKIEEEAAKPVEVNDVLVEIGGASTVREFNENLRGSSPGDERTFDVIYPDDFSDERLAGQVMSYTVKVQGVKKKILPELNDEFAKELGEFATLDELKQRIRENMEAEQKHEIEHVAKEKLMDELIVRNDFPVPQSLVEQQIEVRLDRGFRALAAQGMRPEDLKRMNIARLREGQREAATREVKASLLLDKIAEVENIEASDEDVNSELEMMAVRAKQPVEALRLRLASDGSIDRIRDRIRNEKALDFLYNQPA